jgi:predicted dehydrogenase
MIECHPQWVRVRELLQRGPHRPAPLHRRRLQLQQHQPRRHPQRPFESGGGGLLDIGCYLIHASRLAFGAEPTRVVASIERDPQTQIDRLTSAILEFPTGRSIFHVQHADAPHAASGLMVGTEGRIDLEIPFNALPDRPARLLIDSTGDLRGSGVSAETFPALRPVHPAGRRLHHGRFWRDTEVPVPIEDSIKNMKPSSKPSSAPAALGSGSRFRRIPRSENPDLGHPDLWANICSFQAGNISRPELTIGKCRNKSTKRNLCDCSVFNPCFSRHEPQM